MGGIKGNLIAVSEHKAILITIIINLRKSEGMIYINKEKKEKL